MCAPCDHVEIIMCDFSMLLGEVELFCFMSHCSYVRQVGCCSYCSNLTVSDNMKTLFQTKSVYGIKLSKSFSMRPLFSSSESEFLFRCGSAKLTKYH